MTIKIVLSSTIKTTLIIVQTCRCVKPQHIRIVSSEACEQARVKQSDKDFEYGKIENLREFVSKNDF